MVVSVYATCLAALGVFEKTEIHDTVRCGDVWSTTIR
jgi:hypothetical protein